MNETGFYIAGGCSAAGLFGLWMAYIRAKKSIREEFIEPEIKGIKEEMESMKIDIISLKNNDKELSSKVDQQFESVKQTLSDTNQSIAKMQGTLDLLVKQFVK